MTAYCTVQDVRNALTPKGASADDTEAGKTASTLPDWQIEDAIVEAQTVIDLHVGSRYQIINIDLQELSDPNDEDSELVTVNVAPQPIRAWTRSIAAYFATLTFREHKDLEERDPIQLRYSAIMQLLVGILNGIYNLPLPPVGDEDADAGVEIFNIYEGEMFTLDDFGLTTDPGSRQVYIPRYPSWL
jgi:hypothetical protein